MPEEIRLTEIEANVTFDCYSIRPPSEWFWVVKIAARGDVTKHRSILLLPLYHVLCYADDVIRQIQAQSGTQQA